MGTEAAEGPGGTEASHGSVPALRRHRPRPPTPPPPAPGRSLRAAADVSPAPPPCSPVAGLPPCPAGPGPAFPPPGRVRTAPGLLLAGCGRAGRGVSPPGTGAPCRPPRPGRCAGVEGQFGRWWCGNCSASFSGTVAFKLAGG